jgi:glycosyltransferase involved in cell wall biosynthesis
LFYKKTLPTENEIIKKWKNDQENIIISIICITYNHELYIHDTLKGFLIQECEYPFEIIIHDDASSDKTKDIIESYRKNYPKIIKSIIQSTNQYSKNPNSVLTIPFLLTKGKYIALCEGDDFWYDEHKLQKQVRFLEINQEYSGYSHQSIILNQTKQSFFKLNNPSILTLEHLLRGRLFHTASIVFRRSVLEIFSTAPPVLSADRLLNFCMVSQGNLYYDDKAMCIYRKHGSGISTTGSIKMMKLDLNSVSYLSSIIPNFPKYKYLSYIYITIGLCKNGYLLDKMYYLFLGILLSFSFFPENIALANSFLKKKTK